MAKKKIQCEVESLGLDPTVPHNTLGDDGRLINTQVVPMNVVTEAAALPAETVESIAVAAVPVSSEEIKEEEVPSSLPIETTVSTAKMPKKQRSK